MNKTPSHATPRQTRQASPGTATSPVASSERQGNFTGATQVLQLGGGTTRNSSPGSGHTIPGGFGWLKPDTGVCTVAVSLTNPTIASKTGVSEPSGCTSSNFMAVTGRTILLPVFDDAGSAGNNGWLHFKCFAAFQLIG